MFTEGHWYYNPEYVEIPQSSRSSETDGFAEGYYLCKNDYGNLLLHTPYDRHGDSAYVSQLDGVFLKDMGTKLPKEIKKEYPEYAKTYKEIKDVVR